MLKKLNKIKVEKVLELFAASLIKARKIYIYSKEPINLYDLNPSLMEQSKVVENIRKEIKYDGYALGLNVAGEKAGDIEIKAYNFFLMGCFISFNDFNEKGCSYIDKVDFKIYGFDTFASLNKFVVENPENADDFIIFIKDGNVYKEVFYRYILRTTKGVKQVTYEKFEKAEHSTQSIDIPFLCEFFECESTVEDVHDLYEQISLSNGKIFEKNIDFDNTARLCGAEGDINEILFCCNLADIMHPIENRARYGYITYNNKNSFSLATYKYYLACEDGRGYFDMKRIKAIDTVRSDT